MNTLKINLSKDLDILPHAEDHTSTSITIVDYSIEAVTPTSQQYIRTQNDRINEEINLALSLDLSIFPCLHRLPPYHRLQPNKSKVASSKEKMIIIVTTER